MSTTLKTTLATDGHLADEQTRNKESPLLNILKFTLLLTVSRPVSLGAKLHLGPQDQTYLTVREFRFIFCRGSF
jgi:hypothetical protein